ncbi:eukaryotic aspartyl protease domain-containing protein [Ditylenchus destructor]|uniref:Eukaryotic aspartyl protease domain-containing protein n=1 Tax=Ditylenchus destructor TaxID=166010 RepID=A0AAD4R231_9BILA|nr:eukaryotic aspartyl protease domain-containing protein [Ditylenchus destructor]
MWTVGLYVLLIVCLAMASGVVHKIQTQHHALSSEHSKHLFGHASIRHQQLYRQKVAMPKSCMGKLPLQHVDYFITGTVTVGTPPQSFNVEVDAFYANELILIGPNANLSSVKECVHTKNTYNADNSSTYVAVNGNVSNWELEGQKARDVLNIGSLSVTIKSFVVASKLPYFLNQFPVDGLLGLAPIKKSQMNVSVVADDLIEQLDKPVISVYTNASTSGNGTGQVTLGAEDSDNCETTWSYVPCKANYPFTIHASSVEVTIGGQLTNVNLNTNVTFYHWPAFDVPLKAKDAFVNGTGATYNEIFGEYTIDCDTMKAPLITLNIGGVGNSTDSTSQKLVLSGADYIRYWKSEGVCLLDVSFIRSSYWYLGSQVLNNHCISFNYKERTVGFADSKTPKTDVTKA